MFKTINDTVYANFYLGSTSPIKLNALHSAFQQLGINGNIVSFKVPSDVNEQPIGFDETFNGAINRLTNLSRVMINNGCDISNSLRFTAENGITFSDCGDASDEAIVMVSSIYSTLWVVSKPVVLPASIVKQVKEHTLAKNEGFTNNTIGQSLVELGFTTSSDNWHEELCGVSRIQLLKDVFVELIQKIILHW